MIVIAIPGFVYRKGLEVLVREMGMHNKLECIGTTEQLLDLLNHKVPSVLFVHFSMIPFLKSIQFNKDEIRIVRVHDQKSDMINDTFQADILYLDDDEAVVVKNIKRNLALAEKSVGQESNDSELSDRELDVLREIALGKTNKEIADNLFISAHTVITHRKNITRKLGIKTVSGLTVYAILNKIIQMEEI